MPTQKIHACAPLGVGGLSLALICWLHAAIDTDALYGPGGVKAITALTENNTQRDWTTWLIACVNMLFQDIVVSAYVLVTTSVVATVMALVIIAQRLFSPRCGWFVGLCATLYAPLLWLSLLIGGDAPAIGIAYTGLALGYVVTSPVGLALSTLGIGCIIFATKVKVTALPLLAYVGITPLLQKSRSTFITCSLCMGIAGVLLLQNCVSSSNPHTGTRPSLSFELIRHGFYEIKSLYETVDPIYVLFILSLVGIFTNTSRRLTRLLFTVTIIIVLSYTSEAIGEKLRPRFLIPLTLPLLPLGCGWIGERLRFRFKSIPYWIIALALGAHISFDSLAFFHQWNNHFVQREGLERSLLPYPPTSYIDRYRNLSPLTHSDHSAIGAKDLHELGKTAPIYGVGIPPLRDAREFHLSAIAGLTDKNYRFVNPQNCCRPNESLPKCANRIVQHFDTAGGRLILPVIGRNHNRIPAAQRKWHKILLTTVQSRSAWQTYGNWWGYIDGTGKMGKLPCNNQSRRSGGRP